MDDSTPEIHKKPTRFLLTAEQHRAIAQAFRTWNFDFDAEANLQAVLRARNHDTMAKLIEGRQAREGKA